MTRVAPIPPAETDLLCEFCGYTLNGLDRGGNCPECGMPIAASVASRREPPLWERRPGTFFATSADVIFQPTKFFSRMTARGDNQRAQSFAVRHWLAVSVLFGIAGAMHSKLFYQLGMIRVVVLALMLFFVSSTTLFLTTWLAMRLTAWEAAYRGIRLPRSVVMRAMFYHAAHYIPVGIAAASTVVGYWLLLQNRLLSIDTLVPYLYVICAEIIVAAAYLFKTYWIGMRNLMYANR
jgi:hypothetical protein